MGERMWTESFEGGTSYQDARGAVQDKAFPQLWHQDRLVGGGNARRD
jgi:hypothetical protein